jgi:hypothetical protein
MSIHQSDPMQDKFHGNPNYPKNRKPYHGKKFNWKGTPQGRFALILIGLIGDQAAKGTSVALTRTFPKQAFLFDAVTRIDPLLPSIYKAENPLDEKIMWQRYHKMYHRYIPGKGGFPVRSDEHYENNSNLRPYVDAVRKLWERGLPVSDAEKIAACSPKSHKLI